MSSNSHASSPLQQQPQKPPINNALSSLKQQYELPPFLQQQSLSDKLDYIFERRKQREFTTNLQQEYDANQLETNHHSQNSSSHWSASRHSLGGDDDNEEDDEDALQIETMDSKSPLRDSLNSSSGNQKVHADSTGATTRHTGEQILSQYNYDKNLLNRHHTGGELQRPHHHTEQLETRKSLQRNSSNNSYTEQETSEVDISSQDYTASDAISQNNQSADNFEEKLRHILEKRKMRETAGSKTVSTVRSRIDSKYDIPPSSYSESVSEQVPEEEQADSFRTHEGATSPRTYSTPEKDTLAVQAAAETTTQSAQTPVGKSVSASTITSPRVTTSSSHSQTDATPKKPVLESSTQVDQVKPTVAVAGVQTPPLVIPEPKKPKTVDLGVQYESDESNEDKPDVSANVEQVKEDAKKFEEPSPITNRQQKRNQLRSEPILPDISDDDILNDSSHSGRVQTNQKDGKSTAASQNQQPAADESVQPDEQSTVVVEVESDEDDFNEDDAEESIALFLKSLTPNRAKKMRQSSSATNLSSNSPHRNIRMNRSSDYTSARSERRPSSYHPSSSSSYSTGARTERVRSGSFGRSESRYHSQQQQQPTHERRTSLGSTSYRSRGRGLVLDMGQNAQLRARSSSDIPQFFSTQHQQQHSPRSNQNVGEARTGSPYSVRSAGSTVSQWGFTHDRYQKYRASSLLSRESIDLLSNRPNNSSHYAHIAPAHGNANAQHIHRSFPRMNPSTQGTPSSASTPAFIPQSTSSPMPIVNQNHLLTGGSPRNIPAAEDQTPFSPADTSSSLASPVGGRRIQSVSSQNQQMFSLFAVPKPLTRSPSMQSTFSSEGNEITSHIPDAKSLNRFWDQDFLIQEGTGTRSAVKVMIDGDLGANVEQQDEFPPNLFRQRDALQEVLSKGAQFYKNNHRGKPHVRFFFYDQAKSTLCWCKAPGKKSRTDTRPQSNRAVLLSDIQTIRLFEVPYSEIAKAFKLKVKIAIEKFCVILITTSKKRQARIELLSSDLFKARQWVVGLCQLASEAKHRKQIEQQQNESVNGEGAV